MEISVTTLVLGIAAIIPTVIGFFMVRTMHQVDSALSLLSLKVDALSGKDTELAVAIGKLEVRVENLERERAENVE